ncbi:recombinase family protein [Pseudomonadota bacterium]|jgi:DNA invertase Pin-like site-specific DNA recombinase|nr:recombinase family protein [Pseudomonadota bacterium]
MNMRVVKYQRVSTNNQEVENQTDSIDKQIDLLNWNCVGEYKETISGTKSRDHRPQLRTLLQDSRKRKFDRVIVYSLDRLGRSVVDVINTINELEEVGVHIFVVKNSIDTSTSQGKLFTYFCSIFGEMERDMIISRQKSSIERIRDKQGKWGKGNLHTQETREEILKLKEEGYSYRKICKELNVSLGSVQHTLKTLTV